MAINIQNIVSQINTRLSSVDSNTDQSDILRLMKLADEVENSSGVLEYQFTGDLPIVDSSVVGKLAYIRSANDYLDSAGELAGRVTKFYFAKNDSDGWSELDMQIESQLDSNYQAYLNAGSAADAFWFGGATQGHQAGGISPPYINVIQKFPFTVDAGTATDVGDLTRVRGYSGGWSNTGVSGYSVGGYNPLANTVDKYSLTADGNATSVGTLNQTTGYAMGATNSQEYGYLNGAYPGYGQTDMQRMSFASEGASVALTGTVLPGAGMGSGGLMTPTYGYHAGGRTSPYTNVIQKFPFASDDGASDVGDLSRAKAYVAAAPSETDGYVFGGINPGSPPSPMNDIDKFPFASDTNATNVASLATGMSLANANAGKDAAFVTYGGSAPTTGLQKHDYTSDTRTNMTMTLNTANYAAGNGANS